MMNNLSTPMSMIVMHITGFKGIPWQIKQFICTGSYRFIDYVILKGQCTQLAYLSFHVLYIVRQSLTMS